MSVVASQYVVLDVETNELSSLRDDLLSISIYQPDTQKLYNRFLPLELDRNVYTTHINGISRKPLRLAKMKLMYLLMRSICVIELFLPMAALMKNS